LAAALVGQQMAETVGLAVGVTETAELGERLAQVLLVKGIMVGLGAIVQRNMAAVAVAVQEQ
jgi:hypothetical protein